MSSKETTLQFYKDHAQDFVKGTLSADMSEARQHFLQCLPESARILDFGCGSGRDTKAFLDLGYQVDACDGSEELCRIASEVTGIPVRHMFFQDLNETEQSCGSPETFVPGEGRSDGSIFWHAEVRDRFGLLQFAGYLELWIIQTAGM